MTQYLSKVIADFETQLATQVDIGGTTATLQSIIDDDGVTIPNGQYFLTIDKGNSQKEHWMCTNTAGVLSDIKSVSRQGVQTTGSARVHRVGATVTMTDFAHLQIIVGLLDGSIQFDSSSNLGYDGAPTGLTGNQFATVAYVLSVVSGGTVSFDTQVIANQIAGESLTIRNICYFKESDQRWYNADADLSATFNQVQLGFAMNTASTSQTVQIGLSGVIPGFTGLTPGSKYYISNTAGAITTTPGTTSVFIGWALSSTQILFSPYLKTLPSQTEKDAMAGGGVLGTPSSSNKFLTQTGSSAAGFNQTQATQNSSTVVGAANSTGNRNKIAQSFIPTVTGISGVRLYKAADTGSFTGTVTVSLQADSAGNPSGSALATVTISNAAWLRMPNEEFIANFASEYTSLTSGSTYWIVIETSTSDTSNHPNLGINTAGGYANGSVKFNNTTDGWTAVATIDLYFKTIINKASLALFSNSNSLLDPVFTPASQRMFSYFGISTGGSSTVTITHGLGFIPSYIKAIAQGGSTPNGSPAAVQALVQSYGSATINQSTLAPTYKNAYYTNWWNSAAPSDGSFSGTSTTELVLPSRGATPSANTAVTITKIGPNSLELTFTPTSSGSTTFMYQIDIYV